MNRENLTALLHLLTWVVVIVISLLVKAQVLLSMSIVKPVGWAIFMVGVFVFIWAVVYLRKALFGNVEPTSNTLVRNGPYRFVRHPVYLGMVILTIGLVIGLRSIWGLVAIFLLFVPASIYRAKLEENALARRFGKEWEDYATRTSFLLPPLY